MAKAKAHKEPLQSGGRMDNVTKDYMWKQKIHYHDLMIMKRKGINPYGKEKAKMKNLNTGMIEEVNLYKKIVPVLARVYNPKTGKVETVNIREHNKKVFSKKR